MDAYLAPLLRTNNFSGVVAVAKQGRVTFVKGYGLADAEQRVPNSPGTVFHIASLSKPFTSMAILLLAERGRLDLDQPLSKLLPDYPGGDRLTIHQLLSHRSGIPNINDFDAYQEMQLRPQTTASLVAQFKDKPLEFSPGERYAYSNSNFNLLAHIIERVTGQTYGAFIAQEILRPIALQHTGHRGDMAMIVPALADGYAPQGTMGIERAAYLDWTAKTGNGSLYSTAADLIRFVCAAHGDALLSPESRTRMFAKHSENAGYGWFLTQANGRELHHVNGRSPGWAAQLDHYPKEDVTIVVLSNLYSSVTTPIARAIGAMHFGLVPEAMPALRAEPLSAGETARLVGTYRFGADYYVPNSTITITARGGRIQAEYPSGYTPSPYVPVSPTSFIVRPFWSKAEFTIGSDGNAATLTIDGFRGVREE
ncbi:beta-lactamase family protein [Sphingomonas lutea]|uniref:Beta-lactamase family protein n=1 Tax=Sphingomonas lutea TaxID=1045317 RepID=A0A7G9SJ09_9SPHN|nr:serine hydrolase domain-containing protein [Sphingomonas lutea]QNN67834.1 beta-lactamase family protein [Sphingomonas lutea]